MKIIITLPKQVGFTNDTLRCEGLAGTDEPLLACEVDEKTKTVTIRSAFTYQRGNPGTIKILLSQLRNPSENIVTDSFKIETWTQEDTWTDLGFRLDHVLSNITVNFYCEYPCMSCNRDEQSHCNSCYPQSPFELWHSA